MKKIAILMLAAVILLCFVPFCANAQKEEKTKLKYDTLSKTLTRERTIVLTETIDTARINSEIFRLSVDVAGLNIRIDSLRAQIKEARKLLKGKKGSGGNRAAQTPPLTILAIDPCDSSTVMPGPVTICWKAGKISTITYQGKQEEKPVGTKPKTEKKKKE